MWIDADKMPFIPLYMRYTVYSSNANVKQLSKKGASVDGRNLQHLSTTSPGIKHFSFTTFDVFFMNWWWYATFSGDVFSFIRFISRKWHLVKTWIIDRVAQQIIFGRIDCSVYYRFDVCGHTQSISNQHPMRLCLCRVLKTILNYWDVNNNRRASECGATLCLIITITFMRTMLHSTLMSHWQCRK